MLILLANSAGASRALDFPSHGASFRPESGQSTAVGNSPAVSMLCWSLFNSSNQKVGQEFTVDAGNDGNDSQPSVAMDSSGNFVVTWTVRTLGISAWRRR